MNEIAYLNLEEKCVHWLPIAKIIYHQSTSFRLFCSHDGIFFTLVLWFHLLFFVWTFSGSMAKFHVDVGFWFLFQLFDVIKFFFFCPSFSYILHSQMIVKRKPSLCLPHGFCSTSSSSFLASSISPLEHWWSVHLVENYPMHTIEHYNSRWKTTQDLGDLHRIWNAFTKII